MVISLPTKPLRPNSELKQTAACRLVVKLSEYLAVFTRDYMPKCIFNEMSTLRDVAHFLRRLIPQALIFQHAVQVLPTP